ncbi:MAG TPA: histidine kinase dimerization/phospho-acceptor domain-containing protein, partial [Candidatus Baltobacteraceae bacterium]|nr:histidine kinase dimerization/phospho-acceptor domain-containing protein [Candidatus Baltobacteraceae bacterium]
MLAAGWYSMLMMETFLVNETVAGLIERARLLQLQIAPHLAPLDPLGIDAACKNAGADSKTRYTVILPSGAVVGDSSADPAEMENHAGRPEIAGALARGTDTARRFSTTLHENVIYVASAVPGFDGPAAIVRASVPLTRVEAELSGIRLRFIGIGALIAIAALAVTLGISKRHGRRVRELQEGAARFAEGDLSHRLPAQNSEELAGIAESLNRMAAEIESRMQTVVSQRNQLEVVLSSMQEGVIAVDHEERVISLNPAAASWFDLPLDRARKRNLQEVIRNLPIQKFIMRSLENRSAAEEDMVVFQNGERILNMRSTPLQRTGPETFGALIVFNDVTQLRRLEDMRRDFVANVSHELKTPLTAIKGFVETLHQGQVKPEDAERFLGIIAKHVDRLSVIIEDLLMLSRIEDQAERAEIKRETVRLR